MFVRTENAAEFKRFYPVTFTLICIHIALWLLAALPSHLAESFIHQLIGVNSLISQGDYWRLFTPIFLHLSFSHLLFNSFSLFLLGPGAERILSSYKFLLFYLTCGLLGNIVTFLIQSSFYSHVGASGAIFGLLGFYLYLVIKQKHMLSKSNQQIIVVFLIIGLLSGLLTPGTNNTAHFGGGIAGFLLAFLAFKQKNKPQI
ncbi:MULTISPECIES: rhomboid family intramembrane serine protease [Priestia]|uniref:rhomboid family intramembrane serine protease n=1 Tax=Priestia TaxID=2800373 RepID=UPI002A6B8F6A|nr:rhomboid family intramembrane serine protease [Priestia megaterium]MDY0939571.1 rhomboid family intramembrane serine protease [Priestia megaterium]